MSKLFELANEPEREMLVYIPVERIEPHPDNPRKNLGDLEELTESIREKGILQNLTVVPEGENFRALIGHRRLAAAKLAGLTEVPCVVAEMSYPEQISTMFAENVQRSDLTAYEQAECLQLMIDLGNTQEAVAKQTGLSEATVSRRLRLLRLDRKKFDDAEERGGASLEQYIKVAELKNTTDRKDLLDCIGTDNFNARYARAVKEQTIKELTPKITKEVSAFATKAPDGTSPWSGSYEQEKQCRIVDWTPGAMELKKAKKDAVYYYLFYYESVYILRKRENTPGSENTNKVSDQEKAARKRRRALREITEEMYALRLDFVLNYTGAQKKTDVLMEWALTNAVGPCCGGFYGADFSKKILQDAIGQDPQRTYDIDKELLQTFYEQDPGYATLLILYCAIGDGQCNGYFREGYREEMPSHQKNARLDVIYDFLCRLGYRMCDDEKQLQDGTHPLYRKEEA